MTLHSQLIKILVLLNDQLVKRKKYNNNQTMDISIFTRHQRKIVFEAVFLVSFLFLILLAYNNMNRFRVLTNGISSVNDQQSRNAWRFVASRNVQRQKRLPDVIIVGVKKSGTITLKKFLNYHPSVAAAGEISFFEKGF